MIRKVKYRVREVAPYINWIYFFHAWQMSDKPEEAKLSLRKEAEAMLSEMDSKYHTHAVFGLFDANSDGDDLLIGNVRLPLLRRQEVMEEGEYNLCLADFVRPLSSGIKDKVGVFASTVDISMETDKRDDDYRRMLSQTLSDRLAEATAEKLHEDVRKTYWGYAADEHFAPEELHSEPFIGIRPAVGYPSMPDTSINFIISDIIGMKDIGIRLTENGMMTPHASVSGLMFAHPQARYFSIGKIGEDQLRDYAKRRGLPIELMRKYLASSLL